MADKIDEEAIVLFSPDYYWRKNLLIVVDRDGQNWRKIGAIAVEHCSPKSVDQLCTDYSEDGLLFNHSR